MNSRNFFTKDFQGQNLGSDSPKKLSQLPIFKEISNNGHILKSKRQRRPVSSKSVFLILSIRIEQMEKHIHEKAVLVDLCSHPSLTHCCFSSGLSCSGALMSSKNRVKSLPGRQVLLFSGAWPSPSPSLVWNSWRNFNSLGSLV